MLLFIDKTFVQDILDNNQLAISAINLIALGRRQGNHFVLADRNNLKLIRDNKFINADTKRVFTYLYENYPSFAVIKNKLTFFINITSGLNKMTLKNIGSANICEISYDYFQDLKIATETVVIGENQSEINFYKYIAKYFKEQVGLASISLKCQPRMGGGNTTRVVYSNEQSQEKTFCLCFVDSDKKYPQANIGDTLKAVKKADKADKLLAQYYSLNVREIENIIPLNILEKVTCHDVNHEFGYNTLKKIIESDNYKDVLFLDIKNGLSITNYRRIKDVNLKSFINTICTNADLYTQEQLDEFLKVEKEDDIETKIVIQGLGSNVLDRTIKYIDEYPNTKPSFDFNEQKDEWCRIGEIFVNWTCCDARIL